MNNNRQTKHHPDTGIHTYSLNTPWSTSLCRGRSREDCFQSEENLSKLHRESKGALSSKRKDHIREGNWEGCEDAFALVNTMVRAVGLGQDSTLLSRANSPPEPP